MDKYFVRAIVDEENHEITPLLFAIYMDRLFYRIHMGRFDPNCLLMLVDFFSDPRCRKNAVKCMPILTTRLVQEIKLCQKNIEIVASCKDRAFLKTNNAASRMRMQFNVFRESVSVLSFFTCGYIQELESEYPKDFPLTSENINAQIRNFNGKARELNALVKNLEKE